MQRFVTVGMVCAWGKAVLTGLYSALGKLPDSGFICCCCGLCMFYRSVVVSGMRGREGNGNIDSKPVIVKIVVQILLISCCSLSGSSR